MSLKVVDEGWLRLHVGMNGVGVNYTGAYRYNPELLRETLKQFGVPTIQNFVVTKDENGDRTFYAPLNTKCLEIYTK